MIEFKLLAENESVANALTLFFDNYREGIVQFLNNVLRNEKGSSDAFINKSEDGTIQVWFSAPDKGLVIAYNEDETAASVTEYSTLANNAKYVLFDGQKLSLYIKKEGKPDVKVGSFQNVNDVVTQIKSASVVEAIAALNKQEEEAEALEAKIARKEKLKALAKGPQEETETTTEVSE